jgi:ribosomal protein S18 acetylase RimI-like enzyme
VIDGIVLERLLPERLDEAARMLARAFRDNPGMRALLPGRDSTSRERALVAVMRGFGRATLRYGQARAALAGGRILAACYGFAPGRWPLPLGAHLLAATGPLRAGPRSSLRFAIADRVVGRRHLRAPHWYLFTLGVDPEQQGRGIGSLLLREHLDGADRDGVPGYLETDKLSSVRLYERHGYRVTTDETFPTLDHVRLWTMTRPARKREQQEAPGRELR